MSEDRIKANLVVRNIGELLTIAGHTKPVVNPSEGSLGIIRNHKICIAASISGRICYIGNASDISESIDVTGATEIDAEGKLVIPGFVDSHTHVMFAGSREEEVALKISGTSYLEILSQGGGILKTVRETRAATKDQLFLETRKRLDRMISHGTTSFEIKTGYGLNVKDEIKMLEVLRELKEKSGYDITSTLLSAHAVPEEYLNENQSYIDEVVIPTIDIASERNLAKFCDVFMEEGVFSRNDARKILKYAREKGFQLKIHADEFSDLGGANLAAELKTTSADHLLSSDKEGIRNLSKSGVICTLLPATSLTSLAPHYANARSIISANAPVALATDMSPNSWVESMQFVMSLACYGMRMSPVEAIVGGTINGAHAISCAHEIGSIEVGKFCDLAIMTIEHYQQMPYMIAANNVSKVIKRGKVLYSH